MGIWGSAVVAVIALGIGHMAPLSPLKYRGDPEREVNITFKDPTAVHLLCGGELYKGYQIYACAKVGGNWVIMPNPCPHTQESYARLLCHELGHTNGWPANHPDPQAYEEYPNTLSAGRDTRQSVDKTPR